MDHVDEIPWSEVELWLDVGVFVACCCDSSDAPLHVLSMEFELCFGEVAVVLLDGLGIVCALLVGDGLAGARDFTTSRLATLFNSLPSFVRTFEGTKVPSYEGFLNRPLPLHR